MTDSLSRIYAGCVHEPPMPEDECSGRSSNFHRAGRRLDLGQCSFESFQPVVSAERALVLRHRIMASRPNRKATALRQHLRKVENDTDLELVSITVPLRRVRTSWKHRV